MDTRLLRAAIAYEIERSHLDVGPLQYQQPANNGIAPQPASPTASSDLRGFTYGALTTYVMNQHGFTPMSLLDVGVGSGERFLNAVQAREGRAPFLGSDIFMVDALQENLDAAAALMGGRQCNTATRRLDISTSEPPFEADLVYCMDVLEHVRSLSIPLLYVLDSLKPGGYAIFLLPNRAWFVAAGRMGMEDGFLPCEKHHAWTATPWESIEIVEGGLPRNCVVTDVLGVWVDGLPLRGNGLPGGIADKLPFQPGANQEFVLSDLPEAIAWSLETAIIVHKEGP